MFDSSLASFVRHCEPTGRREAPPDDKLREAIHFDAGVKLDCFVAALLAMTGLCVASYSATSAFMCSTASTKSSLNSCTTAPADFTLSMRPTPCPTK